jgi:uncharacterized protein YcfJ
MAKTIQNNNSQNIVLIVIAVLLLVIGTAAASVYIARSSTPEQPKIAVVTQPAHRVVHREVTTERRVATNCDDGNIVGKGLGGVGGGVAASTIGKGNGKTAATIAGTLGGAYLGGQYIATNGVTCR